MRTIYQISITLSISLFVFVSCKKEEPQPEVSGTEINTSPFSGPTFSNFDLETNISYGNATTQGGVSTNLLMDIYSPQGDNSSNRPLIILAHGGGFHTGTKEDMSDLSIFLAKSGYVVASLKYRLVDVNSTPEVMMKAVIDATHDMRAAVRFFRKDNATLNNYRINPDNIFAGGYSAGAFMGLHSAYLNADAEIIEMGGQVLLNYVNASGGIVGNSGNPGYVSNIRGAISLAGALKNANFINAGEPMIYSFHGTGDIVVPYYTGESDGSGVQTDGPGVFIPVAQSIGLVNKLTTVQNGAHNCFWDTNGAYEDLRNFIQSNLAP